MEIDGNFVLLLENKKQLREDAATEKQQDTAQTFLIN